MTKSTGLADRRSAAAAIVTRADELKYVFLGMALAMPVLLHPDTPLIHILCHPAFGQSPDAPVVLRRIDGSEHSAERLGDVLRRVATLRGDVLKDDVMNFAMMQGATRVADMIDQAKLRDSNEPLLEFARHLRNACAHGNRWYFAGKEPRHPASLRGRHLDRSFHGQQAVWGGGWLGPAEYLDYLDDISTYFSTV